MSESAVILSLLVAFNARWAFGVDIVVKIDKYAPMTDNCDTAINNVEVSLLTIEVLFNRFGNLYECKATCLSDNLVSHMYRVT